MKSDGETPALPALMHSKHCHYGELRWKLWVIYEILIFISYFMDLGYEARRRCERGKLPPWRITYERNTFHKLWRTVDGILEQWTLLNDTVALVHRTAMTMECGLQKELCGFGRNIRCFRASVCCQNFKLWKEHFGFSLKLQNKFTIKGFLCSNRAGNLYFPG